MLLEILRQRYPDLDIPGIVRAFAGGDRRVDRGRHRGVRDALQLLGGIVGATRASSISSIGARRGVGRRRPRLPRAPRSRCASRNCRLSSPSCPTPAPALDATRRVTELSRPDAWDAFVARSDLGSYLQQTPVGAASRPSTAGSRGASSRRRRPGATRSARRSSSDGRARCRGDSPTRRAARSPTDWCEASVGALHGRSCGRGLRRSAGRISHLRIDPEVERGGAA